MPLARPFPVCVAVVLFLLATPSVFARPAAAAPSADLKITKVADRHRVPVGQTVTYTIVLTNRGPDTAIGITFGDSVPDALNLVDFGCSMGTAAGSFCLLDRLEPGKRATATLVATPIPNFAPSEAQIANTAFVTAETADPDATNNQSSTLVLAVKDADLAVKKTAATKTARVGDTVTYTITVKNRGPAAAFNVLVGEGAPDQLGVTAVDCAGGTPVPQFAGACRYDRLAAGETATMTVVATVTLDATPGTLVTNQAFVAESSAPDPAPGNNAGSATIKIVA
jgi:uncharacterized repeat protein (TIGR01451 family)